MMKVLTWFYLSCKRYLRRVSFLVILLLFPIGAMFFRKAETPENRMIRIAVYAEDREADSLGRQLAEALDAYGAREGQDGMFRFESVPSEQAVRDQVASRKAECGYVIYEGLEERLDAKDIRRCIGVYKAPSTVAAELSTETVFSLMIEIYDRILLERYVAENPLLAEAGEEIRTRAAAEAGRLYQMFLDNGSTFHFEYEVVPVDGTADVEARDAAAESVFPVRGLMAVYVFTTGLYGAVTLCGDERRGLFLPLPGRIGGACRFASLAAPVALAAISGLAALWLSQTAGHMGREVTILAGYALAVAVFAYALKCVLKSGQAICCLIPFFIIGSLVFCPVFLDAGRLVPEVENFGKMFLPYYYLRLF